LVEQEALDLAHGHTPRVHRDHLLIEAFQPALPLADQLRLKGAVPIPRHINLYLAVVGYHRLGAGPITAIIPFFGRLRWLSLFISEVMRQLAVQRSLHHRFRQLLQQPTTADDLFRALALLDQLIQ
jgi:hypothetical protein